MKIVLPLLKKLMLRRSVYALRYSAIIVAASILLYLFNPDFGKYILGFGLMSLAIATVLYIVFMFKRYGEKKPIH